MKWPWRRQSRQRRDEKERVNLLLRVAQELSAGLDIVAVARRTVALAGRAVGASTGSLLLVDENGDLMGGVLFYKGRLRSVVPSRARQVLERGLAGWVVRHRQPVLLADVSGDRRWLPLQRPGGEALPAAAVCVPLLLPHRVVGALTFTHTEPGAFDREDLEILRIIADQAAVSIENARLFTTEEQRRQLASTLSEIARTLAATLDLDEVLSLILEQLERVVPYDSASIFLLQDNRLTIRAWRGFEHPERIQSLSFPLDGEHIMVRLVRQREPMVCADVQQEPDWENVPDIPTIHGWIGVPLIARGEVVGALTVDSLQVGAYTEADAQLVAAFADHAAVAIANARLYRQTQRRLEEVAFLYETSQALTASLDLKEVLRTLMGHVREHFRVEAVSVALMDKETGDLVFRVAVGAASDQVVGMRLKPGQGIAGWVVQTGQPVLVQAARQDPRFYDGVDRATGFRTGALMAVPIRLGDEVIGVIEAMNPQEEPLDEEDLRLLLNVAALSASAIQNAWLYARARDAEQRYASLFENSADPILITDASGTITDANRRLCQILGYTKEELIGRPMTDLHPDPEEVRLRLERTLEEGEGTFPRVDAIAKDDSLIPLEIRATRVLHDNRPYIQWVWHDLTERIRLEKARRDLTHMIVHDLRSPISTIMSSMELIHAAQRDEALSSAMPVDELFAIAQRSGEKLFLLIDSILDLAKLEENKTLSQRQPIDPARLVEEVVEQVRPQALAQKQRLEAHIAPGLPIVMGDQRLLQRVLLNLLDNALKFTPVEGSIEVSVEQVDPETVLFAVSDTGPGVPPEDQEQIFERFTRGSDTLVRGTGLGLAFCKLAVEAHGGRIWVESVPGEGATFKFTIPTAQASEAVS
ncbi:MAG TPA: GAF domain-containing protein [Chloroflexi bacterium]|nr:GAF domain-containing protein [Chloroflexota bacterium]